MNQLIRDLPKPDAHAPADEVETHDAKLGRFISSKEEHAEMCKRELRILWADYFNPTLLEQHPGVHDLFWNAMKQASRARQEVDMAAAEQLMATTQQIAELFWQSKGAQTQRVPTRHAVGGELVHPIP
jgi:nickel superoxide dismutase